MSAETVGQRSATRARTLTLVAPFIGFETLQTFVATELDAASGLIELRSAEQPEVFFLAVDASATFPDYVPTVDEQTLTELQLQSSNDTEVLLIVAAGGDQPTVNLAAPVLINPARGLAAQIIDENPQWSIQTPLPL